MVARAEPAVALHYGAQVPLADLKVFDIAVIEPGHGQDPVRYRNTTGSELYAYVSVAEVQSSRPYYPDIPAAWKLARNGAWDSEVIDQTPAQWPEFFATRVIAPLWQQGYRGFFLDTMDSYRLANQFDEAAQQAGLVRVIETLHSRFPGIQLIQNRGFEIVERVRDKIRMVAAESLYKGWNASARRYEDVPPADREWLLGQLRTVRERYQLPVLAIDYVPPHDREQARQTAQRIKELGFIPWVTDSAMHTMGVGSIELVARRVLFMYDSGESPALNYANAHHRVVVECRVRVIVLQQRVAHVVGEVAYPHRGVGVQLGHHVFFAQHIQRVLLNGIDKLTVFVVGNLGFIHVEAGNSYLLVHVNHRRRDVLVGLTHVKSSTGAWYHPEGHFLRVEERTVLGTNKVTRGPLAKTASA